MRDDSWEGCLLYACMLALAYAMMHMATMTVCWSFGLPFRHRYAIGVFIICCVQQWVVRGFDVRRK